MRAVAPSIARGVTLGNCSGRRPLSRPHPKRGVGLSDNPVSQLRRWRGQSWDRWPRRMQNDPLFVDFDPSLRVSRNCSGKRFCEPGLEVKQLVEARRMWTCGHEWLVQEKRRRRVENCPSLRG